MGRHPTKAADSPFCKARLEAAEYNERLYSKEGAAELLGVSVSTLSDYELGITKTIPPDMVLKMADLYNAPELRNYYCTELCPLGYEMQRAEVVDLDRICSSVLEAISMAVWNPKNNKLERLDDGTSDIDSLDALEYSYERRIKKFIKIIRGGTN